MEITQSGEQTENQMKKHGSNIRDRWDNIKLANLHIIGIPEGKEEEKCLVTAYQKEYLTKDGILNKFESYIDFCAEFT